MADAEESQQAVAAPEGEQQAEVKPEEPAQEATEGEAAVAETQQAEATEGAQQEQEETTQQQEENTTQQEEATPDDGAATDATEQQAEEAAGGEEQAEKTEEGGQESESAPEVAQSAEEEAKEEEKEEQKEEETVETSAEPAQQEDRKDEEEKETVQVEEEVSQEAQQEEETGTQQAQEEEQEEVKVNGDVEQVNGIADHQEVVKEMSAEQREMCQKLFDKKASGGRVDLAGFKVVFRLMGEVLSSEDASAMWEEGAKDANGTIDFDEFCRLHTKFSQAEQDRKDAVANSIEKLFPKSDGEPVELKKVESLLLKLQQPDLSMRLVREKSDLGQDDVKKLVKSMDKQGTGLISKNEFVETLCSHLQL